MAEENKTMNQWRKGKRLGSGTFGLVVLWENVETGMTLALKHYKGSMDMKNCDRWIKEVNIMKSLKHRNIIRAFEVPDQLKDSSSQLPVLAMEYCSGGDLRQVFSKPESCYGFSQADVKTILSQICDGLHYLHENEIIHRDLKPENIVLKPRPDKSIEYKIIDLGYAKDIGHGSIPQSFAGTLQYAAPDLLQKRPYSKSVDYWSLGIVTFEMIVGRRPFSPVDNDPVVGWYNAINSRPDNCICMVEDIEGKLKFTEHLPVHNNISRNLRAFFEVWLKHMLLIDQHKRGQAGPKDGLYKNTPWYGMVNEIVATQEYIVLDMTRNRLLVYHSKDIETVTDLHARLAEKEEADIPIADQELVLPDGKIALQTDLPAKRKEPDQVDILPDYFLFRKSKTESEYDIDLKLTPLPAMAAKLAENAKFVVTSARIRLRSWAECLFVCKTMVREAVEIQEGVRTMKMMYMRQFKEMTGIRRTLTNNFTKMQGKHGFFKASVAVDLESYSIQKEVGIKSAGMCAAWQDSQRKFEEMPEELKTCFEELCTRADSLGHMMMETKEYPLKTTHQESLDKCKHTTEQTFIRLRRDLKERPPKDVDCTQLVKTMITSRQERLKLGGSATTQLRKLLALRDDAVNLRREMEQLQQRLADHDAEMMNSQRQRQEIIWKSIGYCMEQYKREKHSRKRPRPYEENLGGAGPSTLTAGPGMLTAGPSTLTAGPSTLTAGPSTLNAGPSTLTAGPSTLTAGPRTLAGPSTLQDAATLATITGPPSYIPQMSSGRAIGYESMRTVEQSLSVSGEFQSMVDRYNNESSARFRELEELDWGFDDPPSAQTGNPATADDDDS